MKKVLLVIPKLYNGGIEKVASNFSKNMSEDYSQLVYSIMKQERSYDFKVKPHILDEGVRSGFFGKFYNFFLRVKMLRKLVKDNNVDVVISFGERCNIITMVSFIRCKVLLTLHSQISIENDKKGIYGFFGNLFAKFLYKNADEIVAVSQIVKDDFLNLTKMKSNKITVIYNGHDFCEIRCKSSLPDEGVIDSDLISVGRVTYAKGHFHLLRAISIVKKVIPDVTLNIIGDYEEPGLEKLMQALINKYNLSENVNLFGYSSNPYAHISRSKCFVLSSVFEGFPGVVIESLALGVPVIATNCGGGTEVLFPGKAPFDLEVLDSSITDFGIISPNCKGIYDINLPISAEEEILAKNIVCVLKGKVSFNKSLLQQRAENYGMEKMMSAYYELIERV